MLGRNTRRFTIKVITALFGLLSGAACDYDAWLRSWFEGDVAELRKHSAARDVAGATHSTSPTN